MSRSRTAGAILAATALLAGLGAAFGDGLGSARDDDARAPLAAASAAAASAQGECGLDSTATAASVVTQEAKAIYRGELSSHAVSADVAHVTGSRALLSALASSNGPAAYAAVHAIVYMPHWHIVRLRVIRAGRVVADVGGPYVISPVSGPLRWNGREVGRFVVSVQDDVGYEKLVSRFTGTPIDIYRNGSFLMGTLQPAPAAVSNGSTVTLGGREYRESVFETLAFPAGRLRIALLVPAVSGASAATSCAGIRVRAWGTIAERIAALFTPLPAHYSDIVDVLRAGGGFAFVRTPSQQLAGGSGPARLPRSGTVRYRGRSWSVFSWEPSPPARIYYLTPSA